MARRFLALAVAGLAALSALAEATPTPAITPAEAASWEGQAVAIRGIVRDVRVGDGTARFDLALDGHAVAVRVDQRPPPEGSPVEARGRLARLGGVLALFADDVLPAALDPASRVSLAALADDPAAWAGRAANVTGTIDHGRLGSDGRSIALGRGDWPKSGSASATVLLAYDPACACHRLDRVAPWTP